MLPLLFLFVGFTLQPQSVPQGVYAVTIADENFPAKFPVEGRAALSGKWELSLTEGNRSRITRNGELVAEGHYTSTADRFAITDETGPLSCAQEPGEESGTYKWTLDGDKLILKGIDDKCAGRRFILILLPWKKQS
jgi:hypothetical protein